MTQPVIEVIDVVQRLGKGAGQVQALKGACLSLAGGQLILLMGPSGSGKTTLLAVLGCMLTPTEGAVRVLGRSTAGHGRASWQNSGASISGSSFNPIGCFRR